MGYVSNGVTIKLDACKTAVASVIQSLLKTVKDRYPDFYSEGQNVITKFVAGIRFKEGSAASAALSIVANCTSIIRSKYSDFQNAGSYLVDGFANGISANDYKAAAAASVMAKAAADAAKKQLDEHSPSKVGYQIGDFFGIAFVKAIINHKNNAADAAFQMAYGAKSGLADAISRIGDFLDGSLDTEPVIRPVLDLSNIESKLPRLDAAFSRNLAGFVNTVGVGNNSAGDFQNAREMKLPGNTYTFTQINNSPKALSRLEIYRQTNNLFSRLQEVRE